MNLLLLTVVFIVLPCCSLAKPNGPPCEAIQTMVPQHGVKAQTSKFPYKFKIFKDGDSTASEISSYSTCQTYIIRIDGPAFKGFLIEARPVDSESDRVGEFLEDSSWETQGIQYVECNSNITDAKDAVAHTDPKRKTKLLLMWKPNRNVGDLQFYVTIVQSKSVFWAHKEVAELYAANRQCVNKNKNKNSPIADLLSVINKGGPAGAAVPAGAPAVRPPTGSDATATDDTDQSEDKTAGDLKESDTAAADSDDTADSKKK